MKTDEIKKMNKEDIEKKIKELKLELIKARLGASKTGTSKIKEIKKILAKLFTLNKSEKEELKKK